MSMVVGARAEGDVEVGGSRGVWWMCILTLIVGVVSSCGIRPCDVMAGISDSLGRLTNLTELLLDSNKLTSKHGGRGESSRGCRCRRESRFVSDVHTYSGRCCRVVVWYMTMLCRGRYPRFTRWSDKPHGAVSGRQQA